jgi:hypothetical protein
MTEPRKQLDSTSTFVVLHPDHSATLVDVTPTICEELDKRFDCFKGRVLISCFGFDSDWSTSGCYRRSSRPNRVTHTFPPLRSAWERCSRFIEQIFRMSE